MISMISSFVFFNTGLVWLCQLVVIVVMTLLNFKGSKPTTLPDITLIPTQDVILLLLLLFYMYIVVSYESKAHILYLMDFMYVLYL